MQWSLQSAHVACASAGIHELDQDINGREMEWELQQVGCNPSVPASLTGKKYVGSAKDVISLQVNGSSKEKLFAARAIWF